jgi:hypothetical protein
MHSTQFGDIVSQAKQLLLVQAQVALLRVYPVAQEVHVLAAPEQVKQFVLHGRHEFPETKYPGAHSMQIVLPLLLLHYVQE